jgi:uncharacterized protein DUF6152
MTRWLQKIFVAVLTFASLTLLEADSVAHHSFAMFDFTKAISFKGSVKEFLWTNPHVILWFSVDPAKEGDPRPVWWAELTSPGNLTRVGWSKHSFKANEPIEIEIHPLRDGSQGGAFKQAKRLETGEVLTSNLRDAERPGLH